MDHIETNRKNEFFINAQHIYLKENSNFNVKPSGFLIMYFSLFQIPCYILPGTWTEMVCDEKYRNQMIVNRPLEIKE